MAAVNLKHVFARRDKLISALKKVTDSSGEITNVSKATEAVLLQIPQLDYSAVFKLISAFPDKKGYLRDLAWLIAGNVTSLKSGNVISPTSWPTIPEFVPVQVVGVCPYFSFRKFRVRLTARVLAGAGCPSLFRFSLTTKQLNYYAKHKKGLGFTADRRNRPYVNPLQLFGCRFYAEIVLQGEKVKFSKLRVTEALRKHNQQLIDARFRRGFVCPFEFKHHCHECDKGSDVCPIAVHKLEYVLKDCAKCKTKERHDLDDGTGVCILCRGKKE